MEMMLSPWAQDAEAINLANIRMIQVEVLLVIYHDVDLLDHVVALNELAAACAPDVIVGISGHGFLIASDSLIKHPSGPGIQPERTISDLSHGQGIAKKYHSAPQCPSRHQLSRL